VDLSEDVFPHDGDLNGRERGVGLKVEESVFGGGFVDDIREILIASREINF
jgi:hypothetical protein